MAPEIVVLEPIVICRSPLHFMQHTFISLVTCSLLNYMLFLLPFTPISDLHPSTHTLRGLIVSSPFPSPFHSNVYPENQLLFTPSSAIHNPIIMYQRGLACSLTLLLLPSPSPPLLPDNIIPASVSHSLSRRCAVSRRSRPNTPFAV